MDPDVPFPDDAVSGGIARDTDLVERAIRRHDAALRAFLRWKAGVAGDDVEDIVQETYEHLLRYRHSDWEELPRTLVMRIAANVVIDRARYSASRHSLQHLLIDELELESSEPTPERRVLAEEDVGLVGAAIRAMPPRCQEVFVLSRIKGMNYAEIAAHLSISVKAVEKHVSHGLALCRQRVREGLR